MSASTHVTSLSSCSCDWNYMKRQAVFLSVRFPPLRPRSLPLGKGQHLRNRNFKGLRCWKLVSPSWPRFGEQHRGMGACGPADISCMLLPHRSSCLKAAVIPRLPPRYVHDEQISGFVGSRKGSHSTCRVDDGISQTGENVTSTMSRSHSTASGAISNPGNHGPLTENTRSWMFMTT